MQQQGTCYAIHPSMKAHLRTGSFAANTPMGRLFCNSTPLIKDFPHPSLDFLMASSCTSMFSPLWCLTKTVHRKHCHPLPPSPLLSYAALWLSYGYSLVTSLKRKLSQQNKKQVCQRLPRNKQQSQQKCSPLSPRISELYLFIEAPGARMEAASSLWAAWTFSFPVCLESRGCQGGSRFHLPRHRQKGKGCLCRKITSISEQRQRSKY